MRKLLFVFMISAMAIALESCLKNENEIKYIDYISLSAGDLPDTVEVNTPISISLRASAPNSCWSNIEFLQGITHDTIYGYAAIATFENHGEACADVLVIKDTVITITPTLLKSYIIQLLETSTVVRVDTIVVIAAE